MAAPFQHAPVSSIMGSWPIVPVVGSLGQPSILPRTLLGRARILGACREPSAGFDVAGESFYLWVDVAGIPTQFHIAFTGTGTLTLQDVVDQINATPSIPLVAYRDNGFLRLESPNTGESSFLRLQTDISSDVLFKLGLFSETISRGGELAPAPTLEPESQVALPGQLSWMEGESFEARVFNRALFQLGVNTDRSEGMLRKKRIAVPTQKDVAYTPSSPEGVTLLGYLYTGDGVSPTPEQLEKWFVVLDEDGRELIKENEITIGSNVATFSVESDTNDTLVTATGTWSPLGSGFQNTDPQSDMYVVPSGLTGAASVLNGVPLKIIQYRSANLVAISPVDPATGNLVTISPAQTGISFTRTRVDTVKCQIDGIYDAAGGSRVEGVEHVRVGPVVPTRIELGTRIVCSGASFITSGVVPGDVVEWESYANTDPYSNNGQYRVSNVVDQETIEVVAADWGPAFLNPDLTSGDPGTITVTTDGSFWQNPFARFKSDGAIPENGQNIRIVCSELSTLSDATDDPGIFLGPGVMYDTKADDTVQRAILAIIGPSATSIEDYVRNDRRVNLEDLDLRLDKEHYGHDGRHSTIRPDVINMFPGVAGTTFTLRNGPGDSSESALKMLLRDSTDSYNRFVLNGLGYLQVGSLAYYPRPAFNIHMGEGGTISDELAVPSIDDYGAINDLTGGLPSAQYYYRVAAIDADGNESVASGEVGVLVNGVSDAAYLVWIEDAGAVRYRVYRSTTPGVYTTYRDLPTGLRVRSFIDCNQGTFLAGTPKSTSIAGSMALRGGLGTQSWTSSKMSFGDAYPAAQLNVNTDDGWVMSLTRVGGRTVQGTGPNKEGAGSPGVFQFMDSGFSVGDDILRTIYRRWTGTAWAQTVATAVTDNEICFFDDVDLPRFLFDFWNGGTFHVFSDAGDDSLILESYDTGNLWGLGVSPSYGALYAKSDNCSRYSFAIDQTTGYIGVCTTSSDFQPRAPIDIRAVDAYANALNAMIVGTDGPRLRMELEASSGGVLDGQVLGAIRFRGSYSPGTFTESANAAITAYSVGNYSGTSSGSKLQFRTTPNGTAVNRVAAEILDYGEGLFNYAIRLPPMATPATYGNGTLYNHTTTRHLEGYNGTLWDRYVPQEFALTAPYDFSGAGNYDVYSIPASTLRAGSTIRVNIGATTWWAGAYGVFPSSLLTLSIRDTGGRSITICTNASINMGTGESELDVYLHMVADITVQNDPMSRAGWNWSSQCSLAMSGYAYPITSTYAGTSASGGTSVDSNTAVTIRIAASRVARINHCRIDIT